jgi:ubiquinone/menaquinone biosynthesis C-methylase UbiE
MLKDEIFKELIAEFSRLYWLKPADIVWDAVPAYHIRKFIGQDDKVLDLGCGDGLFSAVTFGARLPLDYDRFINAAPKNQAIGEGQSGDIYSDPKSAPKLLQRPVRKIDAGLELKAHHLKVAESLDLYDQLFEADFRKIPCPDATFDKVFSAMAFYWGDDMVAQLKEVRRVLKDNGSFLVTLTSEHMYDMHIAKKLSEDENISTPMRKFLEELDGGRRAFVTRHGRTVRQWVDLMREHGFEVTKTVPIINEIMFALQDISQRPFQKMFMKMAGGEDFRSLRGQVKEYLCGKVYPDLLDEILTNEGNENVRHGMYLFEAKKIST